jgi:hypothetical protein
MLRLIITCLLSCASSLIIAQKNKEVILMDFVKILPGKKAEAMFFYENNWKLYRDEALKRGVIRSYEIVESKADTLDNFNLVLITVYTDSVQHSRSEANFEPILRSLRPNGPVLLNELKPSDFRKNVFFKVLKPLFYPKEQD